MATSRKSNKKLIKVDFTGVTADGGGKLIDEGPQLFELVGVEEKEGSESGKDYLEFKLQASEGDADGTVVYDNMSLQPQALWKLRGFMEAAGIPTEDGPMQLDIEGDFIGVMVMGDVIHEEYKNKPKNRIQGYSPAEEPEPATPAAGSKKKVTRKAAEPETPDWQEGQKVSFKDGKKTINGTLTGFDAKSKLWTVDVPKDGEYEMGEEDLIAA